VLQVIFLRIRVQFWSRTIHSQVNNRVAANQRVNLSFTCRNLAASLYKATKIASKKHFVVARSLSVFTSETTSFITIKAVSCRQSIVTSLMAT